MFICIILFFISCISLISFVFMLLLNIHNAFMYILIFLSMISFFGAIIVFYRNTNKYPKNNLSDYYTNQFTSLLNKKKGFYLIRFEKKDGIWTFESDSSLLKLNLDGYLFPHSYLISFVVRNLRYSYISDRLPFRNLFKNKFFLKAGLNVKLEIIDGNRKKEKMVVQNGISKYGFIAKNITFSPFYLFSLKNRGFHSLQNSKSYIDEKRYKQFYIKIRKTN